MLVIKRNHTVEPFNWEKLEQSLIKAFHACNEPVDDDIIDQIEEDMSFPSIVSAYQIQHQVENALMTNDYGEVAKTFIIYRYKEDEKQALEAKKKFIKDYASASNAATGSKVDSNANVTEKNIATLNAELFKADTIKLNRARLADKIRELYGEDLAKEYIRQLESHELYKHDESSIMPYCVAITMYPFLLNGLQDLGGLSAKPKNLDSFCGIFINLCFAISSQFAGALATGEFLMYFDYFARKEWGNDYYKHPDKEIQIFGDVCNNEECPIAGRTIEKVIEQKFQQIVYSMNQPAAARGFQSIFWNISYFDKNYFEGMFGEFYFPDGTQPIWESLSWLQKKFMKWFNKERTKTILTFPWNFDGELKPLLIDLELLILGQQGASNVKCAA